MTTPNRIHKGRVNDPVGTRSRILDAAADLFQRRGYAETSTQDVVKSAAVTSGALHHHFATKKALGIAVIRERVAQVVREVWIDPVEAADRAQVGVENAFAEVIAQLDGQSGVRGCPLNNLALELAFAEPDFQAELDPIFTEWQRAVAARVGSTTSGEFSPEDTATLIVAAYSGAMTLAKATQSAAPLRTVMTMLQRWPGLFEGQPPK